MILLESDARRDTRDGSFAAGIMIEPRRASRRNSPSSLSHKPPDLAQFNENYAMNIHDCREGVHIYLHTHSEGLNAESFAARAAASPRLAAPTDHNTEKSTSTKDRNNENYEKSSNTVSLPAGGNPRVTGANDILLSLTLYPEFIPNSVGRAVHDYGRRIHSLQVGYL